MNKRLRHSKMYGTTPESKRKVPLTSRSDTSCCRSTDADPGMGGSASQRAPRQGTARGTHANVFRVKNLGRGVWGYGVVKGWIPADVCPWNYCRQMGWRQIFSRMTKPLMRTRPYVLGDDGRYHLPERWEKA